MATIEFMPARLTAEETEQLRQAVTCLEGTSFAQRLTDAVGRPVAMLSRTMPQSARRVIAHASETALRGALKFALRTLEVADVGDKLEETADRHLAVGRCALGQITHARLGRHRCLFDVVPAHGDLSCGRRDEARDHAHGRRLSRTIRAQEAQHFAWRDAEGQVIDGQLVAVSLG